MMNSNIRHCFNYTYIKYGIASFQKICITQLTEERDLIEPFDKDTGPSFTWRPLMIALIFG